MDVLQSGESIMVEVAAGPINSSTQEKVLDYFRNFITFQTHHDIFCPVYCYCSVMEICFVINGWDSLVCLPVTL